MLPQTPRAAARRSSACNRRIESIRGDIYSAPDAVAAGAGRAASEPADGARLRRTGCSPNSPRSAATGALPTITPIVTGFARYKDEPVLVVGHHKGGGDTKQKIFRNFGYARPEGYRKALRAMKLAEKFGRAVIAFVDTPAAYPGIESEERGIAEAIAFNLREMAALDVPIIVVVHGEGGSGGALGIAVGDRILMHEFAIYSVIPPEGCAAILWRDAAPQGRGGRSIEADRAGPAAASASSTRSCPSRLAARTPTTSWPQRCSMPRSSATLAEVSARWSRRIAPRARYQKFREMGNVGINEHGVTVIWETVDVRRRSRC